MENIDEVIKAINELLITQDEINRKNEVAIKTLQDKVVELEAKTDRKIEDPAQEKGYPFK